MRNFIHKAHLVFNIILQSLSYWAIYLCFVLFFVYLFSDRLDKATLSLAGMLSFIYLNVKLQK